MESSTKKYLQRNTCRIVLLCDATVDAAQQPREFNDYAALIFDIEIRNTSHRIYYDIDT